MTRSSGVLLHIASLPGSYAIGDLGYEAEKYNLFDNVTSSRLGTDVKRIDVAVMLYNAAKN